MTETQSIMRILWTLRYKQIRQPRKNKHLEVCNLSMLNHEEIEKLNRLMKLVMKSNEIKSLIKNSPKTKVLILMTSQVNPTKHFKKS